MTLGLNLGLGAPPPLVATPKVTDTKPVATNDNNSNNTKEET